MLYFLSNNGVSPDKTLTSATLFYHIKRVFNISKIQKKIQLHILDHIKHSCTINYIFKMSFIAQKK
jgi:hypothetical protein